MVELTWYGHACVGLTHGGDRLIMDPFSPNIGLQPLHATADMVTISHDNPQWHSFTPAVDGEPQLRIHGLTLAKQPLTGLSMRFQALVVGEDIDRGGEPNAMIRVQVDGLKLVHFGDLGHAIEGREAAWLEDTDVWLALAGGPPTIPPELLAEAWRALKPKVLIPIHYRTPSLKGEFGPVDNLLNLVPAEAVKRLGRSTVDLSADTLPAEPEIWVLNPVCDPVAAMA